MEVSPPDAALTRTDDFAALFRDFLQHTMQQAPADEPPIARRLRAHFAAEPATLTISAEDFPPVDHPNLQVALETYLCQPGRSSTALGIISERKKYMGVSMSDLVAPAAGGVWGYSAPIEGPLEYLNVALEDGVLRCVQSGLFLIQDGDEPLAALLNVPVEHGPRGGLRVEVLARDGVVAERLLGELRRTMLERNVFRGKVLSISSDAWGTLQVHFHRLRPVERDQVILADGVLERAERHTFAFARHAEMLLAARRHLKRGMLLHGPPGTGKTLTAMYLAGQMADRTVLLLTGRAMGLIEQSCRMARLLQPSMVILEDVDLVAEERTRPDAGCGPLLFELLNEMDGLSDDADVVFLLTTNRPDLLEPALAARPGRIDQAIEIPLPDADCRRRLLALYAEGLELRTDNLASLVARTEGVSAAFIRELLRKAALLAAEDGDARVVDGRHLDEALRELVVHGGALTQTLLGARLDGGQRACAAS